MEKEKDKKKVKKNVAFTIDVGLYERFLNNYPFLNRSMLVELFLNEISSQISEEEFWEMSKKFRDKNQITFEIWKLFKEKLCKEHSKGKI